MVKVEIMKGIKTFEKDGIRYHPGDRLEVTDAQVVPYIMKVLPQPKQPANAEVNTKISEQTKKKPKLDEKAA